MVLENRTDNGENGWGQDPDFISCPQQENKKIWIKTFHNQYNKCPFKPANSTAVTKPCFFVG